MSPSESSTIDHARISGVISRVVGSFVARGQLRSDEADDVRSTVTLRVLRQFEEGTGDLRNIDDYVARMTINAATDVLRGRRLAPVPLDDVTPEDPSPAADDRCAARQLLVLLWSEIRALPLMQRRALLLHVRDDRNVSAIHLLVFTGVATLDEIALALEYSRAEIEAMWDRLPMPDLALAEILGTTRAHVISFRRAARERLDRARRRLLRWISK